MSQLLNQYYPEGYPTGIFDLDLKNVDEDVFVIYQLAASQYIPIEYLKISRDVVSPLYRIRDNQYTYILNQLIDFIIEGDRLGKSRSEILSELTDELGLTFDHIIMLYYWLTIGGGLLLDDIFNQLISDLMNEQVSVDIIANIVAEELPDYYITYPFIGLIYHWIKAHQRYPNLWTANLDTSDVEILEDINQAASISRQSRISNEQSLVSQWENWNNNYQNNLIGEMQIIDNLV